jgi:hypothetical protein
LFLFLFSVIISVAFPGIFYAKIHDIAIDLSKKITVSNTTDIPSTPEVTEVPDTPYQDATANDDLIPAYQISDPGYIRFGMWEGTIKMIMSSPKIFILGTGPETFAYYFQYFRPLSINYSSEWEYVINKPHNYYLEIWAETGILTLAVYLFTAYLLFARSPLFLKPSLTVFYFTDLFGWPTVVTTMVWWMILVFLSAREGDDEV